MATKLSSEAMEVTESPDKRLLAVSVQATAAGSNYSNIAYYVYQPFLYGEDYTALVNVWDNKDDDVFDNL